MNHVTANHVTVLSLVRRLLIATALATGVSASQAQSPALVEFTSGGKVQRGLRLIELGGEAVIMGTDGWLHALRPSKPQVSIRRVSGEYRPASAVTMRNRLRAEFGRDFETIATDHFLVVQPRGRGRRWPDLFEQSHREFLSYMRRRGVHVRQGRFPMVAVVFPDSHSMYAEFSRLGLDVSRVAGLYANHCNRVMTHDGGRLQEIISTVRHEAAHQSAFNSGVHSRVNDTPTWITEGIGQMFEPSAMSDPHSANDMAERANRNSLKVIRYTFDGRDGPDFSGTIARLIRGDEMFADSTQIDTAYAVSWAMMFYLAERRPDAFANLLNHTATRPPFQTYRSGQRVDDFERIVGCDVSEFSLRLSRFLQSME